MGQAVHVVAVDLAHPRPILEHQIQGHDVELGSRLQILSSPGSIVISEKLGRKLGVGLASRIAATSVAGRHELTVEGVVTGPLSDAYAGLVALMDIYAMHDLIGQAGWFDRVAVVVKEGADAARVADALRQKVSGAGGAVRTASFDRSAPETLAAVQRALRGMAAVGAVVAMMIAYGTTSRRAERRGREFATMRLSGIEGSRAGTVFLLDSVVLGVAGTAVGLVTAWFTAPHLLSALAALPGAMGGVDPAEVQMTRSTAAVGLAVGVVLATIGGLNPARRLAIQPVIDTLVPESPVPSGRSRRTTITIAALAVSIVVALAPFEGGELARTILVLLLAAALVGVLVHQLLPPLTVRLRPLVDMAFPRLGSVLGASLSTRPGEVALAVSVITAVLGAVIAISGVITSVQEEMLRDLKVQYDGSIYVRAAPPGALLSKDFISDETVESIQSLPGVSATSAWALTKLMFRSHQIELMRTDLDTPEARRRLTPVSGTSEVLASRLVDGGAAASSSFLRFFDVNVGDSIELATREGPRSVPIVGEIRESSPGTGYLTMDMAIADSYWARKGVNALRVWGKGDSEALADAIGSRLRGREPAHLFVGEAVIERIRRVMDQFNSALWMVGFSIGVFGGLGILITMIGIVADRQRESELMMAVGLSRAQVTAAVAIDGLLAAGLATTLGTLLGLLMIPTLADTVRADGWIFETQVRAMDVLPIAAFALLASALASAYPALRAGRRSTLTLMTD